MKLVALTTSTKSPRMGIVSGVKYPIKKALVSRGVQLYQIVTTSGRRINVALGDGVIANFKPVYRVK